MILITQGVARGFGLLRFQRTERVRERPNQFEMHPPSSTHTFSH